MTCSLLTDTAHLAELKHELDMLGGGSVVPGGMAVPIQTLRGLQRNIDFQQVPHTTVQQLHATIQHDFELVEQVRHAERLFLEA